jgi:hypothetical protein
MLPKCKKAGAVEADLLIAAAPSAYVPARRASLVDPIAVLRIA